MLRTRIADNDLVFDSSGFSRISLLDTPSGQSAEIVKNLQILITDNDIGIGGFYILEHGFIRYPSGENVSENDVNHESRYVLRAKVSPFQPQAQTPYAILTNYLNAVTLTPDDQLHYYVKFLKGTTSQAALNGKGLNIAYKWAGAARAI